MIFSRYCSSIVPSNIDLRIKENHLIFVDTFKLLGVYLDRELNLNQHFSNVYKKVNHRCAIISRNAYLFSPEFKKTLFISLILTHFDYFSTLLTFIKQSYLMKLEKFFNKSLKLILRLRVSQLNLEEQF